MSTPRQCLNSNRDFRHGKQIDPSTSKPICSRKGAHPGAYTGLRHAAHGVAPRRTRRGAGHRAVAAKVRAWACTYWERAADLPALSPALRTASAENARLLRKW